MITEAAPDGIHEILIMDSDPDTVSLYTDVFNNTGYHLYFAGTVQEGLDLASRHVPDLIFGSEDLLLKKNSDFIKRIRNNTYLQTTVIIAVYKNSTTSDHPAAQHIDMDAHIVKPLNKKDILLQVPLFLEIKSLKDKLCQSRKIINEYRQDKETHDHAFEEQRTALFLNREILENSLRQISMMVEERAQMSETISSLKQTLEEYYRGTISLLSSTIESKRQYHSGHAGRVAGISTFIARQLDLSEKHIQDIETAALLHEIGKLTIPDDLTMKSPLQYTLPEKRFINLHPVSGAAILQSFSGFSSVATIIRHIHEHVNGTGIPDKLRKEDIPIGSRIIAVANLYENLVYQNRKSSVAAAFRIMDDMLNTRFDPKIVFHLHQYADLNPVNEENRTEAISLYELKPGMELAASIYTRSGAILLPIETILTEAFIDRIAQYTKEDPIEKTVFIR